MRRGRPAQNFRAHYTVLMRASSERPPEGGVRAAIHEIIYGVDTPAGKVFDVLLLLAILLSVGAVLLESVPAIEQQYGGALRVAEWTFTLLFTFEYAVRLWTIAHARSYAFSFFGIVDLVAILPAYLSLMAPGSHSLSVVRALRLLRVFRVFKLVRHMREAYGLMAALRAARPKIVVFLGGVMTAAVVFGSVMYLIEGDEAGFTSIPTGIYWAVVTMTTVGYGDIAPQTALGQFLALVLMVLGYAVIAVPTGIVSAELTRAVPAARSRRACPACARAKQDPDANFCKACGAEI